MRVWSIAPIDEAVGRTDVLLDCEVISGLISRHLKDSPETRVEEAFDRVKQSIMPICRMPWHLMRLRVTEQEEV